MATNFLSLRSSAAASLTAVNLTLSTLTGSTITGSTITALSNASTKAITYSTLQGSSITTSTMTGSTLAISSLLQISTSGLLGIGTNPTQALHVQGSTIVSGAIGIGTTNPSSMLDVRPVGTGDAPSYGISHYFPSTYSATVYANQLVASLRFKWYSDLWDISGIRGGGVNWQSLAIRYNGTEYMTIGANGNVGIGATSPGGILQVTNNAGSYTIPTVSISDGTADNFGTYGMVNLTRPMAPGDNKGHIAIIASGYRVGLLGYLNNTTTMGWVSANTMNSSNGIFLNASGNVGIGSNAPGFRLVVNNGSTAGINAVIQASGMVAGDTTSILLGKELAVNNCATILWNHVANGSAANYLGLGYYAGDNQLNVTCNGRVGIGITNPAQTLDVNGTIARNGLKLPRFDYGTVGPATSISIPILFSDTQYNVVEIRFRYEVSAITDINMSATSTTPATMNLGEVGLTIVKYNAQSAPVYWNNAGTTSFIFASNVEMVGTGGNLMFRIVRSIGSGGAGQRNHYSYDNVYCWSSVGTARGYGQGHIDNTGVGGPALAYLNLICVSGNINGNWSTTHYN